MNITNALTQLYSQKILSDLDFYFAKFIAQLANRPADEVLLLSAALVSYFTAQGYVCVDLSTQAEQNFPQFPAILRCPPLTVWLKALSLCNVVGTHGDYAPLILDQHRLYLYRYWDYEQQLAKLIRTRLNQPLLPHSQESLQRLFEQAELRKAAQAAISQHFCIISGGPGTGKTTLILKILILLLEQNSKLRIALTAPTGKAVARLKQMLTTLRCAPEIRAQLPKETYTLHRLLEHHQLPYEVVIVDEASMVDLALMTKLAQRLAPNARWILLGDKDQLNSVGSILRDLCEACSSKATVQFLQRNYRFHQASGIYQLAQAVKEGRGEAAWQILKSPEYPEVHWLQSFENAIHTFIEKFADCLNDPEPANWLLKLTKVGILCAVREGAYGVYAINHLIEQKLIEKGWTQGSPRPIMMVRNDYRLNLFSGEVGIILPNPTELQAFFPAEGTYRTCWPPSLPEYETAYAMTIHQSQSSEFEEVLIILPEQFSPFLTRELIYTAITRAKQTVSIYGNEQIFKQIVSQSVARISGLQVRLDGLS